MIGFLLRRLLIAFALVWIVATLVFLAIHLVPGDPAELLLAQGGIAPDPQSVADLRFQLGLDQPILTQYLHYVGGLLRLDLGQSLQDGHPIVNEIALRLPRTLELIGAAGLLAIGGGVPLGLFAALNADSRLDRAIGALASLGLSLPVFVIGTLIILVFAQGLHWVPAGGDVPWSQNPGQHLVQLLMPAGTIAVGFGAVVLRVTRSAVLEVAARDHVRAARARGVAPGVIMRRHLLRNALTPLVTVIGLHLGSLLGGTVLVEFVFNWPGLSGYLVSSVDARDYPEVTGIVLVLSVLFVLLNLIVDLLYAVIDPRVRQG